MAASDYQRAAQKRYRDKRKRDPEALLYHLRYQMRANAKKRAEAAGLPFSLSVHDIVIPEVCPVLGIPLAGPTGEKSGPQDNSPSLDRIRPALGYVPGNVRVISYKANRLRNNGTFVELMQVVIDAARIHNAYGDL